MFAWRRSHVWLHLNASSWLVLVVPSEVRVWQASNCFQEGMVLHIVGLEIFVVENDRTVCRLLGRRQKGSDGMENTIDIDSIKKTVEEFDQIIRDAIIAKYRSAGTVVLQHHLKNSIYSRWNINDFISKYLQAEKYPEDRIAKTVNNLIDFKLQLYFIFEVDEWLYPSRTDLESKNRCIAARAALWELSLNQSIIGKSRVLWERLMNLVYFMETGKDLEGKKSKKTAFFKFVDGCPTWKFPSPYKEIIEEHDDSLRTPEFHKGSVLRSILMGKKEIKFEDYRRLYGYALNGLWENLTSIAGGGKATHFSQLHCDADGRLLDEYT